MGDEFDKQQAEFAKHAHSDAIKRAQRRPLDPTEELVACTNCCEPAGKRCRYDFEGKRKVTIWPHTERKRLHHRTRAVEKVMDIILASELRHRIGDVPRLKVREVAERIMDALHGKLADTR